MTDTGPSIHTPWKPRRIEGPTLATVVRIASAQYEKKFAAQVIHHRRNHQRDMLVALSAFVRTHGRAALGFSK
jgi:hypothetical protein